MTTTTTRSARRTGAAYFLPRPLHPGAWWLWALGLAVAVSRTTNLIILALVAAVVAVVVAARRGDAPWALSFRLYVWMAGFIVALRVVFRIVFSAGGTHILFTLPQLRLPGPFAAAQLFGPVSAEALLGGLQSGAQLGVMVLCVGAANALANPKRLLAAVPGALYEFGTVVVITLSVFPQLAESVWRVNRARLLRDGRAGKKHFLRGVIMPVLADALERSLDLAAAMDSRGYGRQAGVPAGTRRWTGALLLLSLGAFCVGLYGLLDGSGTQWFDVAVVAGVSLATIMVLAGFLLAGLSLRLAGRRVVRSRYRPDPWRGAEWLVTLCGLVPAACLIWWAGHAPQLVYPVPLQWPDLPPALLAGLLVGALPGFLTPALAPSAAAQPDAQSADTRISDAQPVAEEAR